VAVNSWSVISEPLASDKAFITSIDIVAPVVPAAGLGPAVDHVVIPLGAQPEIVPAVFCVQIVGQGPHLGHGIVGAAETPAAGQRALLRMGGKNFN